MSRGGLYLVDSSLQVVERASATGAGDVLRLDELDAGRLQDGVGKVAQGGLVETLCLYIEQVRLLVYEDGTNGHGGLQLEFFQG